MRAALLSKRQSQSGFVLPTTTLLIVVMLLVAGALIFRSYQRSTDVIGDYQQQSVQNAATPAIERAKAKLELLFKDRPVTAIYENTLEEVLAGEAELPEEQLTFTGEERISIPGTTGNARNDLAWKFDTDTDGNGTADATTIYTIVLRTTTGEPDSPDRTMDPKLAANSEAQLVKNDEDKANLLLVRNGPLLGSGQRQESEEECDVVVDPSSAVFGWFPIGTALYRKNFQVYALTVPKTPDGQVNLSTLSTIQYQQDRTFEGLNKWGAWFRTDLEVTPGEPFNWNGAMHTEGTLFIRPKRPFRSYLISDDNSCFYQPELNSEISMWGHLVYGALSGSTETGTVSIDLYADPTNPEPLGDATDSFDGSEALIDIALNPIALVKQDLSQTRGGVNLRDVDDPIWNDGNLPNRVKILQDQQPAPYIDDTYRADNLFGPKPKYTVGSTEISGTIGETLSNEKLITNDPPVTSPAEYGLDGYWERRARGEGLRVIVGQRLELGNPFGWVTDLNQDGNYGDDGEKGRGDDPLNPPDGTFTPPTPKGANEFRQHRTLRDNLAAVQATAVYYYDQADGYTPVACLATTVHPGTEQSLKDSATFKTVEVNGNETLMTDFFFGHGTNGWEFDVPDPSAAQMQKALTNLANFAGDPDGAYPVSTVGDPDPYLTMWGNFSNLRRAVGGATSLADDTTKQTAACALGMLAYNISYLQAFDYEDAGDKAAINALYEDALKFDADPANAGYLFNENNDDGEIVLETDGGGNDVISVYGQDETLLMQVPKLTNGTPTILPPEAYIAALKAADRPLARLIHTKEQVKRDRLFGFQQSPRTGTESAKYKYDVTQDLNFSFSGATYDKTGDGDDTAEEISSVVAGCNFSEDTGNDYFGFGVPSDEADEDAKKAAEQKFITLARVFCSPQPKFPALYYVFPTADSEDIDQGGLGEPYVDNGGGTGTYEAFTDAEIKTIADSAKPRELANWELPQESGTPNNANAAPNDSRQELIKHNDDDIRVAIKDSALFNPREQMNVRVLNLDLELLKDTWLPPSGIVYAFREDAVREDAIYKTGDPDPTDLEDLNTSPKSVDYYAEPDRRPYAFRLKNGEDISREDTIRGMTFVSDQPVYTQGNFNLHGDQNEIEELTPPLEGEFDGFYNRTARNGSFAEPDADPWRPVELVADAITILSDNFCDGSIEDGFVTTADPEIDVQNKYGCPNVKYTSYLNQNRPKGGETVEWQRENPLEISSAGAFGLSPILISPNNEPMKADGNPYTGDYYRFDAFPWNSGRKQIKVPDDTWVNMVMVNGIVPGREGQSDGGLQNFPRFIEDWQRKDLFIQGSFIQLNYSNYATGPYEHDAWEPNQNPVPGVTTNFGGTSSGGTQNFFYYLAPNRKWGYDVGLQYLPAGPLSSRMSELSNERNEFYREPKADDPYICKLRAALSDDLACSE